MINSEHNIQKVDTINFNKNSLIIGKSTESFLKSVYPAYLVNEQDIDNFLSPNSTSILEEMIFFRINRCSEETVDELFATMNAKFEKLLTALHSINTSIAYGLISKDGVTNLVLGIHSNKNVNIVSKITQGMLSGIDLERYEPNFIVHEQSVNHGLLAGIPTLHLNEEKQNFSLSPIMRSLNGEDYTVLFVAKPVPINKTSEKTSKLISIRDQAFTISKRNISQSSNYSFSESFSETESETESSTGAQVGGGFGAALGATIGSLIAPGPGTAAGGIIGGGLGTLIGSLVTGNKSNSTSISESISKTISQGESISLDIQNGFALELINYCDKAIERLKIGQNNGIWETAITYSSGSPESRNIIKACLKGELSKPDPDNLPLLSFDIDQPDRSDTLLIPDFLKSTNENPLCSYLNSSELGLLCTPPTESVPDFEIRIEKAYPLTRKTSNSNSFQIGNLIDGKNSLDNMPFLLSELDLNKHTFICGITGSGKTTTVKKILIEAKKPFLVIESAKKEYRNLSTDSTIYTMGRPEINCPQINPFYIMPGVSPQTHIDFLKDLFNASFSFYGPMPYILEKCLHAIYKNKGWELTFGYHPLIHNTKSQVDFFDINHIKQQYANISHKFLFPTMQELKDEIARYIEEELKYDGEVAGNVKTAMKVRLENLCIGAKGYTFNTYEHLDFNKLLQENIIFELEGLADDDDKAFAVGLLVVFINEYRQVNKELSGNKKTELLHLLVIEEAHRLLKNVDTERSTETTGNPKGKAVEHFTNMIAEMRSYGQGVIVAEQIPTKLAPDVIKNSSTKIVQRIVSADDQKLIANTIGITAEDALQLGTLESGYAFCHTEGMSLPIKVKISNTYTDTNGNEEALDVFVSDETLYNKDNNRLNKINLSIISETLGSDTKAIKNTLAFINTLFVESHENVISACEEIIKYFTSLLRQRDTNIILSDDPRSIITTYLTQSIFRLLTRGLYSVKNLPSDSFYMELLETLYIPTANKIKTLKSELSKLYSQDIELMTKEVVAQLISMELSKSTNIDINKSICTHFINISHTNHNEITVLINKLNSKENVK